MANPKQVTIEYHINTIKEGDTWYYGQVYREAKMDGQRVPGTADYQLIKLGPYPTRNEAYRSAVKRRKQWAKADYMGAGLGKVS